MIIEELLKRVHELTGGYGIVISASCINGRPDDYIISATFRDRSTYGCYRVVSQDETVEGRSMDAVLGKVIRHLEGLEKARKDHYRDLLGKESHA